MDKAPDAFRTISEVAEVLETPAHVLRFWESRFPQIKPVKRAGGRRYYRPADVALLSGIRQLLHTEGMTIRGVQKVLREQGVRHVAGLGGDLVDLDLEADLDLQAEDSVAPQASPVVVPMTGLVRRAADVPVLQVTPFEKLFPLPPPEVRPNATTDLPRDAEGGFIAFSPPRMAKAKPAPDPAQPSLPFEPEVPHVIEAPHVFVEAEPQPKASVTPLGVEPAARPGAPETPVTRTPTPGKSAAEVPALAGISARLRHLAAPLSPQTAGALAEVHSRLGLLHAQMAEAQRLRRPAV
jgi:DNA-binding transcriptional MerR regulator